MIQIEKIKTKLSMVILFRKIGQIKFNVLVCYSKVHSQHSVQLDH